MKSDKADLDDYGVQPLSTTQAYIGSATVLVAQLNQRVIDWLAVTPHCRPAGVGEWLSLGPASQARTRLVGFPLALVNVHFESKKWWQPSRRPVGITDRMDGNSDAATRALMRETLTLAWYMARTPQMPRFLLGMAPEVAHILANLSMRDIDAIVTDHSAQLRLRWGDAPGFWAELLAAAVDANEERWSNVQLHAFQLLGRDLLLHGVHLPSGRPRRAPA